MRLARPMSPHKMENCSNFPKNTVMQECGVHIVIISTKLSRFIFSFVMKNQIAFDFSNSITK